LSLFHHGARYHSRDASADFENCWPPTEEVEVLVIELSPQPREHVVIRGAR